jgi:hypothetical protein
MTFGNLMVLKFLDMGKRAKDSSWLCLCSCGKECIRYASSLKNRRSKRHSCGCLKQSPLTHGHTTGGKWSPEYRSYQAMLDRCTDPTNNRYAMYTSRGITICARWLESFENFLADMGQKPTPKHSIDRIDNDGNYEPGNCRWATAMQQRHNRRDKCFYEPMPNAPEIAAGTSGTAP